MEACNGSKLDKKLYLIIRTFYHMKLYYILDRLPLMFSL